ncbi:MAG: flagellar hook-associated protein FlgK [Frankiales bacterium]|nr:flagellar hook-associated protein FlgK [Frankiales bacterium]
MSTFSGITNASAALAAQQYGLNVTGQNISNANTPGYVRQRAELAEAAPVNGVSTIFSRNVGASTGVTVSDTTRVNDPVLDARARTEHGKNGYAAAMSNTMSDVQNFFDEPSDTGIAEQLNDLWSSFTAVSNNPSDNSARSVVLQQAGKVTSSLNTAAGAIADLTTATKDQLTQTITDVNASAASVAKLNGAIAVGKVTGQDTNSLQDQRDALLLKMADDAGTTTSLQTDGTYTVTLGGQTLVSGSTVNVVALTSSNALTVGGNAAAAAGGNAQGLVDALTTVIPGYSSKLDAVAGALATSVNNASSNGFDLSGAAGGAFFSGTTAATISVAITDPSKIAASSTPGGNLGGGTALILAGFGTLAGGADKTYAAFISSLGADVQRVAQQATTQNSVTTSVDAQAQSISGVSFDEEAANLMTYQRAYEASARVLTTVDSTLDTLINRTGRVGL